MKKNRSFTLALILVGWGVAVEAQVIKQLDAQPAVRLVSPAEKAVTSTNSPGVSGPSAAGPGTKTPVANSPVNTIDMGQKPPGLFNPATKFPGAGGATENQGTTGQTTPAIPVAKPLGGDRKNVGPQSPLGGKGVKVTPDYFTREQQLRDLTDPKAGMKDAGAGGVKGKSPLDRKSGADLLGGIPTTVAPGDGKSKVSDRDQHSSNPGDWSTTEFEYATGKFEQIKHYENGDKVTIRWNGTDPLAKTTISESKQDTYVITQDSVGRFKQMIVTDNRDYSQKIYDRVGKDWKLRETHDRNGFPIKTGGDKKTPNPETDTGDGHNPKGGLLGEVEKTPKSPSEMEAERMRQVTLPGEGPPQPERVYLSQQDALQGGIRKLTDGRIDPGDPTAAAPTGGIQGATPRPGFGPERVDGRVGQPGLQGGSLVTPQVAPPTGGNTPDNPTAAQDSESPPLPSPTADGK